MAGAASVRDLLSPTLSRLSETAPRNVAIGSGLPLYLGDWRQSPECIRANGRANKAGVLVELWAECAQLSIQRTGSWTRIAKAGKCRDGVAQENHYAQGSR